MHVSLLCRLLLYANISFSFGNTYPINGLGNITRQRTVRGVQAVKPGQTHWTFSKRPPLVPPGTTAAQLPLYRNNSLNTAITARPQVYEVYNNI